MPTQYLALGAALNDKVANPFYGNGGTGVIGAATIARSQLLKPFPQFLNINAGTDFNHARYDSVVMRMQKRMSKGLTFLATYTWSKNMDASFASGNFLNVQSTTAPQNYYDLASEYSLAIANTPSRFVGTATYELPFGKGKAYLKSSKALGYVVGGWQVNFITTYQTRLPALYRAVEPELGHRRAGAAAQRHRRVAGGPPGR